MAAKIRFLYNFEFDSATITASSEVTTLPAANVVHKLAGRVWRTSGASFEWIKFDLGNAKQIKEVAIVNHNLTSGATITLEANSLDAWTSPPFSIAIPWRQTMVIFLDQTYQWWRITFADTENPDGYIEVGRICAGVYYEPGRNIINDYHKIYVDPSTSFETPGWQRYYQLKRLYWQYKVAFRDLEEPEQDNLLTMYKAIRNTEPVIVSIDPDKPEDTIYAELKTPLAYAVRLLNYANFELVFEEKM